MNFSPKTCCRLCAKTHKKEDINVPNDSELGKIIKIIYGVEMESSDLSTFVCQDCRVSTIAFSANYDRVQYVQGQLKKYSSMSSTSNDEKEKQEKEKRSVPLLQAISSKPTRANKTVPTKPYKKIDSAMKFKLGDQVKFVRFGELIHGVIDGLFSKLGKYQVKTAEGEIHKIFHLAVLRDD